MKNNLENSFKESLGNHEMPYNASAWTALSAKLDAKTPVANPKSNFKWYAAASTIVILAVSSYFIFRGETENPAQNDVVTAQNDATNNNGTSTTTNNVEDNTNTVASDNNNNIVNPTDGNVDVINPTNPTANNNPANLANNQEPGANVTQPGDENRGNVGNEGNHGNRNTNPNLATVEPNTLIIPTIADLCQGSKFNVENENDEALLIEGPGLHFIVPANTTRSVRTKESGLHSISSLNPEFNAPRREFIVKNAPTANFVIDSETKFEKGLPTTKVETTVSGADFNWIFNNQKVNGPKADAHFYTKGDHKISLIVTGSNGCKTTETKTIYVEEKYNLIAMNAFTPTSLIASNKTFMPYALTERDAKFTLLVFDRRDGHVVFESNDANNGWDGTDMKTGNPVPYDQAYIWKVIIENPELGEDNEYSGSITPLR